MDTKSLSDHLDGTLMPPRDDEAETAVIGSILLRPDVMDDVSRVLQSEAFRDEFYGGVYRLMLERHDANKKIDIVLLAPGIRKLATTHGMTSGEAMARIEEAIIGARVAGHVMHYAGRVVKMNTYRRIREVGESLMRLAQAADDPPDQLLDRAEEMLSGITQKQANEPVPIATAAIEAMDRIDERHHRTQTVGYMTGLKKYDSHHGGLFPGELIVLAARPGIGKTSLACQIAQYGAERGRCVYLASLEMSASELATRVMCSKGLVSMKLVRTGQLGQSHHAALAAAAQPMAEQTWWIHDKPTMTTTEIRRWCRRLKKKQGLSLVIVDYIQLLTPIDRRVQRHEQVGQMSAALKALARELEVPVLCLCQLNREIEKDKLRPPRLSDIRESGSIEQDADVVAFLHVTDERVLKREVIFPETPIEVELHIAKNRNGERGKIELDFVAAYTQFYDRNESPLLPVERYADQSANEWDPDRRFAGKE